MIFSNKLAFIPLDMDLGKCVSKSNLNFRYILNFVEHHLSLGNRKMHSF